MRNEMAPSASAYARAQVELAAKRGLLPEPSEITPEWVRDQFARAGKTILALRVTGTRPAEYGSGWPDVVQDAIEAYGWNLDRVRPSAPSAADIAHMDVVFSWLALIPEQKRTLRRILALRSLTHPIRDEPIYSWRQIGRALGCAESSVRMWHANAIEDVRRSVGEPPCANRAICSTNRAKIGQSRIRPPIPPQVSRHAAFTQGEIIGDAGGDLFLVWSFTLGVVHAIPLKHACTGISEPLTVTFMAERDELSQDVVVPATRETLHAELAARRHFAPTAVTRFAASIGDALPRIGAAIGKMAREEGENTIRSAQFARVR